MKLLRRHDAIYLALALLLAAIGVIAGQVLKDSDVGWVFGVFTVTLVIVQFMYVYELRNNISFFVSDYLKIRDKFLKSVVDEKLNEVQQLAEKAGKERRIDLNLDDLFRFVTLLVRTCNKLEAVDIRTERWDQDIRAKNYFKANREARKRGAAISRIFVFNRSARDDLAAFLSKGTESEDIKQIRKLLKQQQRVGIDVAFIFSDDPDDGDSDGDVRDFGIFDDERVLDENFDGLGHSKYEGFISSVPNEVRMYGERYRRLSKLAENNRAALERLVAD
jgi:hypothetical protein